jgi:hypothetical protein
VALILSNFQVSPPNDCREPFPVQNIENMKVNEVDLSLVLQNEKANKNINFKIIAS